jgi:phosphomannomutase/phosphoglucomutase
VTQLVIRPSIFREYDIRGIAERDLSPAFAETLGRAYAKLISARTPMASRKHLTVAVGQDCRVTSESYANALIQGLTQSGLDVIHLGVCPTPLTYFSVYDLNLDGGIMVTGSHNPAEYNGFKTCVGKETIYGSKIQEIRVLMEQMISTQEIHPRLGRVSEYPIISRYTDYVVSKARPLRKKKIVLDAGNGTASTVAPELFRQLGAEVIPLFCELDGRFPNHHPDPTVPENLKQLVKTVLQEKADFGLAFDGDSDRLGVVDNQGRILYGDELMVLFSRSVLKENPGATIISEVKSSHRLYDDIRAKGGNPIMWKTGHSLIKSKMKETQAALAGEMSGHIFFADRYFGFDDAIYAGVRVFEILSDSIRPLSDHLSDLPSSVSTPEIRVECEEELKFQLVEEAKKLLHAKYTITDIDGVRVSFHDGWGLVRASNTQPVLVLRFEATTITNLKSNREIVEEALKKAAQHIGHPPINTEESAPHA